jgi:large subunit ribosomal protein L30
MTIVTRHLNNYFNFQPIMAQIKITQVKSIIDRPKRQRLNMEALGLRKISASVVHNPTPQILGMVNKIKHLVRVEEVNA